jgi:glycosyltransferase involved in cell wall biosynthesis
LALVSAIIPVHNGEATSSRALRSVFAQNYAQLEVIVVDDGSTDSTRSLFSAFGARLEIIEQDNAGPAAARNAGIAAARGEYIAFLDADDRWLPRKIELTVNELERSPAAVLAFSDVLPVDSKGALIAQSLIPAECSHAPTMEELLSRWWPIFPSTVVMRCETLRACGGFDPDFRKPGYEDPLLWLHARRLGEFRYVDLPLTEYRLAPELERMEKYADGLSIFVSHVRRDFGTEAQPSIEELNAAHMSILGAAGVRAMAAGDIANARRAFRCALRYAPADGRTISRLLRSYLPAPLRSMLSSPRRRKRAKTPGIASSHGPA